MKTLTKVELRESAMSAKFYFGDHDRHPKYYKFWSIEALDGFKGIMSALEGKTQEEVASIVHSECVCGGGNLSGNLVTMSHFGQKRTMGF